VGGLRLHHRGARRSRGGIRAPWRGPDSRSDDPHRAPATRAGQRRAESDPGRGGGDFQPHARQVQPALAVGVEEAELTGAVEAFGQDRLQPPPPEVGAGEGAGLPAFRLRVPIAEGHLAVIRGEKVLLLQDAPVPIATQIDQGRWARNTLARALWLNRSRGPCLTHQSRRSASRAAAGMTRWTGGWSSKRREWVCRTAIAPGVPCRSRSVRLNDRTVCQAHGIKAP